MKDVATLDDLRPFEDRIAEMAAEGWDQDDAGRFDWDDFTGRVEQYLDISLPGDYEDPVLKRFKRVAREAAREARS